MDDEYWAVTANIKREIPFGPGGDETKIGTKQFRGGAKVHIVGSYPGTCSSLLVIGQNKHSGKTILSVVRVRAVENLRVKKLYGNSEISLLQGEQRNGVNMVRSKSDAEELLTIIPGWAEDDV